MFPKPQSNTTETFTPSEIAFAQIKDSYKSVRCSATIVSICIETLLCINICARGFYTPIYRGNNMAVSILPVSASFFPSKRIDNHHFL